MDLKENKPLDLDKIREALDSLSTTCMSADNGIDIIDLSSAQCMDDTITISQSGGASGTISLGGGLTYSSGLPNVTIANGAYTTSAFGNVWGGHPLSLNQSGQIELKGDNADISVNGKSLMKTLENIEQRLNMLTANPEMEAEWDELRELGERYRELEKQCKEKSKMWDKLKSMPPPQIP